MNEAERDLKYIWHPCSQMKDYETLPPIVIDHAKGLYLYDICGKSYADVVSSWWCNLLGHSNDRINNAIKRQVEKLEQVIFANFTHEPAIELCERLSEIVPEGLTKFFFTDNGSSAIEASMKMSFQYHAQTGNPQKKRFMSLSNGYHGETLGALALGAVDLYSEIYKPLMLDVIHVTAPDCYRCPYGKSRENCGAECFEHAEKAFAAHGEETAAFFMEPLLQGAGGMRIYPPLYLNKLRAICSRYNVHMIADEIATGFGRTGKMFACGHADVSPDIMCISKGVTGGYMPMAMAVVREEIYRAFYADYNEGRAFMHSHTYCANPMACAAGIEVLKIFAEEDILTIAAANAKYFHTMLKEKTKDLPNVGEVRSIGLINAIELVRDRDNKEPFDSKKRLGYQIYIEALKMGVLLRPLGDVLYFNPPLTIKQQEMDFVTDVCFAAMAKVKM